MNKKFIIWHIFLTFAFGFLIHGIYSWIPSPITSIFPVNESLFEHAKLIFYSPIFSSIILYFIFKRKGYVVNNFLFGLMVSIVFNIFIFYLIFLPIYYEIGENLTVTLIIYFISICLSGYMYYLIINGSFDSKKLNVISCVILLLIAIVLTYFTYHPLKIDFFRDPKDNSYGLKK